MRRLVAIHQPNFLPWLGYFDKLARAAVFVVLDDVQFPRTSKGTWMNRVKLLVGGAPKWVTMPVVRAEGIGRPINEVRIDDAQPWREKTLRTIRHEYARAAHFDEAFPLVEEILGEETDNLADFNERGVRRLAEAIGIDTSKLVRSSTLDADGAATELMVALTKAVGGDAYLAGGLAPDAYHEDEQFAAAGVELVLQRFEHPTYDQGTDEFVPGLSVVDALMHVGAERVRSLLERP